MEAAVRTVHKLVTGEELAGIEYTDLRGDALRRETTVDLGPVLGEVKLAVVHTLKEARRLMDEVKAGNSPYGFVEVMACPGGCAGGGGQPRSKHSYQGTALDRKQGIYNIDRDSSVRQSHNNPMITTIYADFLKKPLGHKSHELLHTTYRNRMRKISHTMDRIWKEIEERS